MSCRCRARQWCRRERFVKELPKQNAALIAVKYSSPSLCGQAVLGLGQHTFERAQETLFGGFFHTHPEARAVLFQNGGRELLVRVARDSPHPGSRWNRS